MSCYARFNTTILVSKGLIPCEELKPLLEKCCKELQLDLKGNDLIANNVKIADITIKDRITATYYQNSEVITDLRDLLTKRSEIMHQNYLSELVKEKESIKKSELEYAEFCKKLDSIDSKIEKSERAKEIQLSNECEALKKELTDAAKEKGYEIVEEKTNSGVQLQFIRSSY